MASQTFGDLTINPSSNIPSYGDGSVIINGENLKLTSLGTTNTFTTISSSQTIDKLISIPTPLLSSDSFVLTKSSDFLFNKNLTDKSNIVYSSGLRNASDLVILTNTSVQTAGQILITTGSDTAIWSSSPPPSGSANSSDITGTYPDPVLTLTGLTAGNYGSASLIPVFNADDKGRIHRVSDTPIIINTANIATNAITSDKIAPGTIGSTQLNNTGVVAGTYGSTSSVSRVTIDSKGRTTVASDVPILAQTANIASNAITSDKIAANQVGSSQLNSTGVVAGTYGSSTSISRVTIDSNGRITVASDVALESFLPADISVGSFDVQIDTTAVNLNSTTWQRMPFNNTKASFGSNAPVLVDERIRLTKDGKYLINTNIVNSHLTDVGQTSGLYFLVSSTVTSDIGGFNPVNERMFVSINVQQLNGFYATSLTTIYNKINSDLPLDLEIDFVLKHDSNPQNYTTLPAYLINQSVSCPYVGFRTSDFLSDALQYNQSDVGVSNISFVYLGT